MHSLKALDEVELKRLTRVAGRLFNTLQWLSPGHRPHPQRAGPGIEFLDFREFSAGDDSRNIDWRTSARSRHPQIRRYRDVAAADWFIVLDCSASMIAGGSKKWILASQCAAALAYVLIQLGNRAGILLFSDRVKNMLAPGRGHKHYANILHTIRETSVPESGGRSELRSCASLIKRKSPVIVISDFLVADYMRKGLDALSIRGARLFALQILSSSDTALPSATNVSLKCVESGQILSTQLNSTERENYRTAVQNFNDSLIQYCQKQGIHFSRHQDSELWNSVLLSHFLGQNSR